MVNSLPWCSGNGRRLRPAAAHHAQLSAADVETPAGGADQRLDLHAGNDVMEPSKAQATESKPRSEHVVVDVCSTIRTERPWAEACGRARRVVRKGGVGELASGPVHDLLVVDGVWGDKS